MLLVSHNIQQRGHEHDGCYVTLPFEVSLKCCPTGRCCSDSRTSSPCCRSSGSAPDAVKVVVELTAREGPCPACGVLSSAVKERPLSRLKDLPACGQQVELWWRKRRLVCGETLVPAALVHPDLHCGAAAGPGHRTAPRAVATAIAGANRAVVRRRRRVRGVVADRAQGPDRGGGAVVAGTDPTTRVGDR